MYRAVTELATVLGSPIVTFRDGSGTEPANVSDVSVVTIDWSREARVRQAFFPSRRILREAERAMAGADCVVAHSLFRSHALIVHRIATACGVPYVIVPHGALEPALWQRKRLLRRAWMLAGGEAYLRDAAKVVFATTGERAHAAQTLGRTLPAEVIPFGVPSRPEPATAAERSAARALLGLPADRRLLLMLGRLDPVKRPREVVRWFCEADPVGCDLVVAGMDGAISAVSLREDVPPAFRSRVWILGGVHGPRHAATLAACDGYLSWSLHESFGYAAAECMGAGLPVILAPGHGLRSELLDVACGFFPGNDGREGLVEALHEFARWPEEAVQARANAGRAWVRGHLAPSVVAGRWQGLLADVVARRSAAPG
jgi:glycosyltransferase involved in cell wall biosynthesis